MTFKILGLKVEGFFAWYDGWWGVYWDRRRKHLYICPLPMCVVKLSFSKQKENQNHEQET